MILISIPSSFSQITLLYNHINVTSYHTPMLPLIQVTPLHSTPFHSMPFPPIHVATMSPQHVWVSHLCHESPLLKPFPPLNQSMMFDRCNLITITRTISDDLHHSFIHSFIHSIYILALLSSPLLHLFSSFS